MTTQEKRTFENIVDLEQLDDDLFKSSFTEPWHQTAYGGTLAAQAIVAAGRTLDGSKSPHSLQMYFPRPGDTNQSMTYRVNRDLDGRRYAMRQVVVEQSGRLLARVGVSFHRGDISDDVQTARAPGFAPPAEQETPRWIRPYSTEVRCATGENEPRYPLKLWTRITADLGDDSVLNAAALAYISDMSTGLSEYVRAETVPPASLNHMIWFHRPSRLGDWVLLQLEPRSISDGRGLYNGTIFDKDGAMLASISQEQVFVSRSGNMPAASREDHDGA